ncbi:hypothetical protein IZY60_01545 [Lutibacter sp. B2]|nr:hypothetical protein [Lutibacter sp. B2]
MREKNLINIEKKLTNLMRDLEKTRISEYVDMLDKPMKLLYVNFMIGLARGLGTAIGLTILAAIFFYILNQIVDLPLIGKHIARLIEIIENYK